MMGVPGLTAFVDENPWLLQDHRLHHTRLVIDGNNLYHFLYYYFHINHQYGGDYLHFSRSVHYFFTTLQTCQVSPYVIFDGCHDVGNRKLSTILRRARERIHLASFLSQGGRGRVLPILAYDTFRTALDECGIPHGTCQMEADEEIAALANTWDCPVLSNDSDFFVFPLQQGLVLLDYLDLKIHSHTESDSEQTAYHLQVQLYKQETLQHRFPGMDAGRLALFATMQGNDYISRSEFSAFYVNADLCPVQKKKQTKKKHKKGKTPPKSRHKQIKMTSLLTFLGEQESIEFAMNYVISFIPVHKQKSLSSQIKQCVENYTDLACKQLSCFHSHGLLDSTCVPKLETPLSPSSVLQIKTPLSPSSALLIKTPLSPSSALQIKTPLAPSATLRTWLGSHLPQWFMSFVCAGKISVLPLNAAVNRRVLLLAQVEDMAQISSYSCAVPIRALIYGILLSVDHDHSQSIKSNKKQTCAVEEYDRDKKNLTCEWVEANFSWPDGSVVPRLTGIPSLPVEERCVMYDEAMKLPSQLHPALSELNILMTVISFWVQHARPKVKYIHLYALWLCVLKLRVIGPGKQEKGSEDCLQESDEKTVLSEVAFSGDGDDAQRDYNLSSENFECADDTSWQCPEEESHLGDSVTSLDVLSKACTQTQCKFAADNLARFGCAPVTGGRFVPDATHVHAFAQFQAVHKAALDLNGILYCPFVPNSIALTLQGTFLYNMSVELSRRSQPLIYIMEKLGRRSVLAEWYRNSLRYILNWLPEDVLVDTGVNLDKKHKKQAKPRRSAPPTEQPGHGDGGGGENEGRRGEDEDRHCEDEDGCGEDEDRRGEDEDRLDEDRLDEDEDRGEELGWPLDNRFHHLALDE